MSLIDLVAIPLLLSLAYIGYQKGAAKKSVFLASFFIASVLFYFTFDFINTTLIHYIKSFVASALITFALIIMPSFIASYILLLKVFADGSRLSKYKSKSLTLFSRISGVILGLIGGYVFITSAFVLSIRSIKKQCCNQQIPSIIESSIFYQFVGKSESNAKTKDVKIDNLPALKFLYTNEVITKFGFTQDDVVVLLKIMRGISNEATAAIVEMNNSKATEASTYIELFTMYTKELSAVQPEYQVDLYQIAMLTDKVKKLLPTSATEDIQPQAVQGPEISGTPPSALPVRDERSIHDTVKASAAKMKI